LSIKASSIHGDGRRHPENGVIEGCAMLPFRKEALPVERAELRVAQPNGGQVRRWTAGTRGHFDADHSIFSAITLRPFHTQLMESFQILLIDGRNGGTLFCSFDECPKGLQ
jgi:hypothetical protein